MSAITITSRRTVARLLSVFSTHFVCAVYLAAVALVTIFRLVAAEGLPESALTIWALAAGQLLPVLTAFFAMDTWSDERQTGRMDLLLSIAVREREYVVGKILGVWTHGFVVLMISHISMVILLAFFAPSALRSIRLVSLIPTFFILLLQNALWSAVGVMVSAFFRRAFVSAIVATVLVSVFPRVAWEAAIICAPRSASVFGEMPFDAQVFDFSSGLFSLSTLLSYPIFTVAAALIAIQAVGMTRFKGCGSKLARLGSVAVMILALATSISAAFLFMRAETVLELPVQGMREISPRLRKVLAEASGELSLTAFLSRKDPSFRRIARDLRALKRQADATLGLSLSLHFVDPAWDLANAERLVRKGASENSIVFERGGRLLAYPIRAELDDRLVASAIRSLVLPPRRPGIYWTIGHGEIAFDSYGIWGMSDIARELVRNGYRNISLDLAKGQAIPADCALIVIAGAKNEFARAEQIRLDAYLKSGGRLLVLLNGASENGISSLLSAWGVRPVFQPVPDAQTLSGSDVIVADFSDHTLSSAFQGLRLVLGRPVSLFPSAAVAQGSGADRLKFTALAGVGASTLVALVERGGTIGADLAIRPTRLVVVGDASFVMNGQLAARAHSNRDFFLNTVAYLSGTEVLDASDQNANVLDLALDREGVRKLSLCALGVPAALLLLAMFVIQSRRSRT